MIAATSHNDRCVCTECLRIKYPPTVDAQLQEARAIRSDSIQRLDGYQRQLLNKFTKRWNADRLRRGLGPKLAHDALTEGLEALIAMIGQE